ncbi:SGNH/GDSL hydrolase family protein [Streptomyces boninensis]|uniref:SGNH/GDSL hydrolase family protein n=1 Tax=Streptomyces boninensis TaxID=2039455 RepID=UPI003B21D0B4
MQTAVQTTHPLRRAAAALSAAALAAATLLTLSAAPAHAADDAAAGEVYVALGDSMASGPLIPSPTGPLACGRSTHNYAHTLAARLGVATLRDVTCSGADTKDMTNPQKLSLAGVDAGEAPPQFDALTADTTLVTLTIGGNDVGLVGVAQDCMTVNPFATPCKGEFAAEVQRKTTELGPKLAAVLDGIHARAPKAKVLVTGYGAYIKPGGCFPLQPVLNSDADFLQGSVDAMSAVIATQAKAHGATYVDVKTPSAGHDACAAPAKRWLEGYVPTALAAPLHPNRRGEEAYAGIIAGHLG